eukprot:COSAG05_NODE_219_length_13727_cov_118.855958_5_plen_121_part_00
MISLNNTGEANSVAFQAVATTGGKVAVDKLYLTPEGDPADAQSLKCNREKTADDGYSYFGTSQEAGTLTTAQLESRALNRTRLLARAALAIEAYDDSGTGELQFVPSKRQLFFTLLTTGH